MAFMILQEELKDSMEKVVRASVQKTEFMAFLCHELRNPLHTLVNVSSIVQETTPLDQDKRELFDAIQASASYMSELINDVLDTSLFESGQIKLADPLPFVKSLKELVDFTVGDALVHDLRNRGIDFSCTVKEDYSDGVKALLCLDVGKVKQVIVNLMSNAVKFTEKNGRISCTFECNLAETPSGKAKVWPGNTKRRRTNGNRGHILKFSVTDSGIGMTDETIKSLFVPFQIANVTTTREYGGTGLGLVICKNIVDLMDGKLSVQSSPNCGTTFTVEIPICVMSGAEHRPSTVLARIVQEAPRTNPIRFGLDAPVKVSVIDVNVEFPESHPTSSLKRMEMKLRESKNSLVRLSISNSIRQSPNAGTDSLFSASRRQSSTSMQTSGQVTSPTSNTTPQFIQNTHHLSLPRSVEDGNLVIGSGSVRVALCVNTGPSSGVSINVEKTDPSTETSKSDPNSRDIEKSNTIGRNRSKTSSTKQILIVDDSAINRKILIKFLRAIDPKFKIVEAVNGQEACEKVSANGFDICFMDLTMPVMGGREAIQKIKQELRAEFPVIAVTGDSLPPEELEYLYKIGFHEVQPKPFTKEKIEKYLLECFK
ncbi:UNVERIFIED_CONTAM: hypothetical protein HDU68_002990 [Siphonaria sp. JEL0065]|nr:hypothetical protein HDU68_002990 [Siphonaria sp. JEL0065]